MATEWFIKRDGKQHGPFASAQLKRLAENGQVTPDTEVKRGTDRSWFTARSVRGLFPGANPKEEEREPEGEKLREDQEDEPETHPHQANATHAMENGRRAAMVGTKEPAGYTLHKQRARETEIWVILLMMLAGFMLRLFHRYYLWSRGDGFRRIVEADTLDLIWLILPFVLVFSGFLLSLVMGIRRRKPGRFLLGFGLAFLFLILVAAGIL